MGQLEKYGLYVLCLVIFLILGVALWGEPASASESSAKAPAHTPAAAAPAFDLSDFKELSTPAPKAQPVQPEPHDDGNVAVDAGTGGGNGTAEKPAPAPGGDGKKAESAERRSYTIVGGDSFEGIAKKELGDAKLVTLLRELNPKVQPERMQVGKQLVLPSASELAALRAKSQPGKADSGKTDAAKTDAGKAEATKKDAAKADAGKATTARTHRVEKGDTLEGIAKRYLGSEKRVDDIKKLNPTVDPTRMRIGQMIRLPD